MSEINQLENRAFYKYNYMNVSVIRTSDKFYNATKICQEKIRFMSMALMLDLSNCVDN